MEYKIIIFNKFFYKEIKLEDKMRRGFTLGTENNCHVRFRADQFPVRFVIGMRYVNNEWLMECGGSIFLRKDNPSGQSVIVPKHQDTISVCDNRSSVELFKIKYVIDFGVNNKDYDRCVIIKNTASIKIGGTVDSTICIADPMLAGEWVILSNNGGALIIDQSRMKYAITKNGTEQRESLVQLVDKDFFTIHGYSFYYSEGALYTSKEFPIRTALQYKIIRYESNNLHYPCFVRSARQQFEIPEDRLQILPPVSKPIEPRKNLIGTILPIMMSMGMMVGMRIAMGSNIKMAIMFAGMATVSIIMGVINYRNENIQHKIDTVKRENDYNIYISEQEDKIRQIREKEQMIANQKYPSVEEHIGFVEDFDSRLFEKLKEHDDYYSVCIGQGTVESKNQVEYKEQEYRQVEDPLADYPEKIHDKYRYISDMPVVLDLKDKNAVGFIGNRNQLYQMVKNTIMVLATEHYYQDMKLFLLMDETDASFFYWARWIKNMTIGPIRNFAYDDESNKVILEYLYNELNDRKKLTKNQIDDLPTCIVLVYRSSIISKHPVSNFIENASALGFVFLFFEDYAENLNQYCAKRIFINDASNTGYIQDVKNGEKVQTFRFNHIPLERISAAAAKLACVYSDEVSLESTLTKNITLYELLGIMTAYDLDIESRWKESKIFESMAAPLGVKSGGEIVSLDLHEKYHGPHGLVAGTTGSGKSEILQSYILSMATLFHPYEVGFIIIDFKGGGMVNQFRDLPHLNGAITNIDGHEIDRSLLSIKAELNKRQEYFAEYKVNHINDYIKLYKQGIAKKPLPHLILIVDEFAELKSDQPEFMKELISAARIGRSLGVHLILATQKPSGVVNDQIWSNSRFKLCLKVQNQNDSNEVIKSPLAAEIREPGRAYLQVGNNEIFQLFQSAYSGAVSQIDASGKTKSFRISRVGLAGQREVIYEQKENRSQDGETQLQAIVKYVADYCEKNNIERLPNICLPPLPGILEFKSYDRSRSDELFAFIGLLDDPDRQRQEILKLSVTSQNIFIVGSTQTGKTNLLQTMIRSLCENYSVEELNIYIIDFGSMILRNYSELNHVGGVVTPSEDERLRNMIKLLENEIVSRKDRLVRSGVSSFSAYKEAGFTDMPQIVVFIDNVTALKEMYMQNNDFLLPLFRDGVTVGVSFVAANGHTNGIGYRYLSNFETKIALFCNDSTEYSTLLEGVKLRPSDVAGRMVTCINKVPYEVQTFLAFNGDREIERVQQIKNFVSITNNRNDGMKAKIIPEIPKEFGVDYIKNNYPMMVRKDSLVLGIDYATVSPCVVDFKKLNVLTVSGKKELGRETFTKYIVDSVCNNSTSGAMLYILDDMGRRWSEYEKRPETVKYNSVNENIPVITEEIEMKLNQRYGETINDQPWVVLVVESASVMDEISKDKDTAARIRNMIMKYKDMKFILLLSNVENAPIAFGASEMMKIVRENRKYFIFEDIPNIRLCDISIATAKKFTKALTEHDAFFVNDNEIIKLKTVKRG